VHQPRSFQPWNLSAVDAGEEKRADTHGGSITPAHLPPSLIFAWRTFKITFEHRVALMKPLSTTEVEVLQELADGLGTAEIAASRRTSAQVIKNCTYRACQKLGADNRFN
jgi:DNA-binding NarL/FixJ family response regulator